MDRCGIDEHVLQLDGARKLTLDDACRRPPPQTGCREHVCLVDGCDSATTTECELRCHAYHALHFSRGIHALINHALAAVAVASRSGFTDVESTGQLADEQQVH